MLEAFASLPLLEITIPITTFDRNTIPQEYPPHSDLQSNSMASAGFDFGPYGENLMALLRERAGTARAVAIPHVDQCGCLDTIANRLNCGHRVCEFCQYSTFINHQPKDKLISFYSELSNFYGKNEATPIGVLVPTKACPWNCAAAVVVLTIPRIPHCPLHVKKLLVSSQIQERTEKEQQETSTVPAPPSNAVAQSSHSRNDRRWNFYFLYDPEPLFAQPDSETGVKKIDLINTVHMYPQEIINFNDLSNSNLPEKVMLLRVRPQNENYSTNAVYVWVQKTQTLGALIEKLIYILGGLKTDGLRHTHSLFLSVNGSDVIGWDRPLGEVLKHNMTVHTELEW